MKKIYAFAGTVPGRLAVMAGALALTSSSVMAQGSDLWSDATAAATTAAGNVGTFLIALFAVPLAFFAYKLVRKAIGG